MCVYLPISHLLQWQQISQRQGKKATFFPIEHWCRSAEENSLIQPICSIELLLSITVLVDQIAWTLTEEDNTCACWFFSSIIHTHDNLRFSMFQFTYTSILGSFPFEVCSTKRDVSKNLLADPSTLSYIFISPHIYLQIIKHLKKWLEALLAKFEIHLWTNPIITNKFCLI